MSNCTNSALHRTHLGFMTTWPVCWNFYWSIGNTVKVTLAPSCEVRWYRRHLYTNRVQNLDSFEILSNFTVIVAMKRVREDQVVPSDKKLKGNNHDYEVTRQNVVRCSEFVVDSRRFEGKFPYFREPAEISSFSLDIQREFHHDRSLLRLYAPPNNVNNVAFNLRDGYDIFIKRDETKKECLDELLRCILLSTEKFQPNAAVGDQDNTNLK